MSAALVAGNAVVAKPAEQTPLIAAEVFRLMHQAGVPASALHLVPGDGRAGAALVADARIAGVAFTGSTEVARAINRALAAKDGPIVPLIAETGGINAMVVDATALPEQVTDDLTEEVFGPVLHVVRYKADALDRLLDDIAATGYGLTLGVHSRIDTNVEQVLARLANGNVYVNRSMIGAVVGTQPFGGTGLSGTGPKAGGPNYLRRFASEQVVTVNTAAAGGNASLLAAEESAAEQS